MEKKHIAYVRVSTERQGRSGLGLDAQRASIAGYIKAVEGKVAGEFVEVESGKHDERPQLAAALSACKRYGATLIIAKLDRLSRNVAFIAALMQSGAEFVAVDMPHANKLTIHLMAAVAEYEREAISARTKAALQQAKARGIKLGNPNGLRVEDAQKGRTIAVQSNMKRAKEYADRFRPIIDDYRKAGFSFCAIARRLSETGELTPQGGSAWTATTVRRVIELSAEKRKYN